MRRFKDIALNVITYLFSSVGIISVLAIFIFIFMEGVPSLSLGLITGDYHIESYTLSLPEIKTEGFSHEEIEGEYFSTNLGISLINDYDIEGKPVVKISYIHPGSPLLNMVNEAQGELYAVEEGEIVETVIIETKDGYSYAYKKDGARAIRDKLEEAIAIKSLNVNTEGGGIRGSLITTIYMILLTLLFALPLGIAAAVYLGVYAKDNRFNNTLRAMIDMISGIPSIVFGLVGAMIFIPFFNVAAKTNGGSILSGALTMSIMLLPLIVKTTEEAIKLVPKSYRDASLALGASQTETTFKVILPNAMPGILTATILSIGRIIGESAALIFAVGTAIQDKINIRDGSSTLAVHIWYLMGGENPNYGTSSAIAIIILIMVLILNLIVKLIGSRINRYEVI